MHLTNKDWKLAERERAEDSIAARFLNCLQEYLLPEIKTHEIRRVRGFTSLQIVGMSRELEAIPLYNKLLVGDNSWGSDYKPHVCLSHEFCYGDPQLFQKFKDLALIVTDKTVLK